MTISEIMSDTKTIPSYEEAQRRVAELKIQSSFDYCRRRSQELPEKPAQAYADQWIDWAHFLSGTPKNRYERSD